MLHIIASDNEPNVILLVHPAPVHQQSVAELEGDSQKKTGIQLSMGKQVFVTP